MWPMQPAFPRVARRQRVVQLLELSDVVQDRARDHEVGVGAVAAGQLIAHLRDLDDVLEEAGAVRVVQRLRGRPRAELLPARGHDPLEQLTEEGVGYARDPALQFGPHLVGRPGSRQDAVLLAEAVVPVLVGVDATDVLHDELDPFVVEVPSGADLHELAGFELALEPFDVLEDLGRNPAGRVLEHQRDELAVAAGPRLLRGAQAEAETGRFGCQLTDRRESRRRHRHAPGSTLRPPPPGRRPGATLTGGVRPAPARRRSARSPWQARSWGRTAPTAGASRGSSQ